MAHLPNSKIKIVLQNLKGECWTVNSVPTTRVNTSHTLCGGWIAFVRCNDIKVGDICIFELVRECELRVHILGVGREGLDCQNGKVACSRSSGGRAPSSHKTLKVLPKKTKGKSPKASKRRQEAPFSIDVRKQCSASKTYTRAPVGSQSKAANKKLGKVFNYFLFEFAVKNWFNRRISAFTIGFDFHILLVNCLQEWTIVANLKKKNFWSEIKLDVFTMYL